MLSLWCSSHEHRRLNLDGAILVHIIPEESNDRVTHVEVFLKPFPAKIEVSVFEAHFLTNLRSGCRRVEKAASQIR